MRHSTGTGELWYLVSLVLAVLFADAAHERPGLAALLQAHKLDGVDLVLRTQRLLVWFVGQRDTAVFGQGAGGVSELRALGTEVCGTHRAVHRCSVALVLVTSDDALQDRTSAVNNICRDLYIFPLQEPGLIFLSQSGH